MKLNRRAFLKGAGAGVAASACASGLASSLFSFPAHAQSQGDYKALVCVFLYGGMDAHDVVLPYDQASYNQFKQVRQSLLTIQGSARQRENLLPLNPISHKQGNRQFALPPEMAGVKQLFDAGDAAIIGNVGPMIEPVSKAALEAKAVKLPPRLFSHNDQQAIWQSSAPEGAQTGWGGLFADHAASSNTGKTFTNISTDGSALFLTGNTVQSYQISTQGAAKIGILEHLSEDTEQAELEAALRHHFGKNTVNYDHLLHGDMSAILNNAYSANSAFDRATQAATQSISTTFPTGQLGGQLNAVAKTISLRKELGVSRQVFFVGMGGFDTHSNQAKSLPALLTQIDQGLVAFSQAMKEMGLHNNVTLFTASDFGRTLAVNGDGTDHGWGSHHFVMGGAVKGNDIYGTIPESTLGHERDAGGGRLIPDISVDQFAYPLGRWFGVSDAHLQHALPNLKHFTAPPLTFL
ncbi:DUF1501 domain-containing protein [Aestuariibacter sp. AA17]|uniref:DUF1501 domain-containing protein n=1 Tax=Fluctibacter corallii TaxID=2984329 RepID=A0ABT3AAJ4_9ALTE|nr:DUF1501 domain-containing protein [Aestuariibacter sp. AA17]MCV2885679.1 DUF1501 domain-containing protein [Aestuariibacter sp. AA17]